MSELRISPTLGLPLDAVTESMAIVATRGAGKTETATVIAEEVIKHGLQVCIMDVVGVWWGLRSSKDGKGPGLDILILGGEHGDLPLAVSDAGTVAQFVVEGRASVVLDLSSFTKGEQTRFAEVFFDRLWHLKAKDEFRTPVLLILEEAQELAPQKPGPGEAVMLGRVERLAKLGRNRGIGMLLITQRPASLNKDVLNLVSTLLLMRLIAPHDRKAVQAWVAAYGVQEQAQRVMDELATLPTGTAWLWSPQWLQKLERVAIRQRETFDSSATPKVGQKRAEPARRAEVDLEALKAKLGQMVEKAKADDPRELRKRIAELERQVKKSAASATSEPERIEVRVEVPVVTDVERVHLQTLGTRISEAQGALDRVQRDVNALTEAIEARSSSATSEAAIAGRSRPASGDRGNRTPKPSYQPAPKVERNVAESSNGAFHPSGPQQRILDSLAKLAAARVTEPTRTQAAAFAGASPKSSGFEKNVSTLSTGGLIRYPGPGRLALTDAGAAQAEHVGTPPTVEEFQEYIYRLISGPQARLLRFLVSAWPEAIDREQLAARGGVSPRSSGFEKNVSTLSSFGFVEYPERGYVAATEMLFLENGR